MTEFIESNLKFFFPENWEVKQFDQTRFFKYFSGYGFKGVDFLVITDEPKLLFIEVKNFADRYPADGIQPIDRLQANLDSFSEKMVGKFKDSAHLLQIIYKVFLRKWWFRHFALPLSARLPFSFVIKKDWGFWLTTHKLLEKKEIEFVLWIEFSEEMAEAEATFIFEKINSMVLSKMPVPTLKICNQRKNDTRIIGHP